MFFLFFFFERHNVVDFFFIFVFVLFAAAAAVLSAFEREREITHNFRMQRENICQKQLIAAQKNVNNYERMQLASL